jgi:hypothetical protein
MTLVKRHFLGWDKPPLEAARHWLSLGERGGAWGSALDSALRSRESAALDLSGLTIITPGSRVGRLLLGMLVDRADALDVRFSPPHFSTPGEIPEVILGPLGKPAGPIQRRLAWSRALSNAAPQQIEALIPHRPDAGDHRAWHAIASMLESAHDTLIGEGLRFADVPEKAAGLLSDLETSRWLSAAVIQGLYADELREVGLVDTGLARLDALNNPAHPVTSSRIVLIGVQEPSLVARHALARSPIPAETLIFAPESFAAMFDDFGGLVIDEWHDRPIAISDESILLASTPEDQARRAMEAIAGLRSQFSPHQISIAAPDPELVHPLQRAAKRYAGAEAHAAAGTPLSRTSFYQLLRAIEAFLDGESFASFSVLVRHPDLERHLLRAVGVGRRETWLKELDKYGETHIPGPGLDDALPTSEIWGTLGKVGHIVRRAIAPLKDRPPAPGAVFRVLNRIYSGNRVNRDDPAVRPELRAAEVVRHAVAELASLPPHWLPDSGLAILRLVLDIVAAQSIPHEGGSANELELLGWLELPMDPAPAAIITGFNDGLIPESFGPDALLPDTLREKLGIACSRRRMARDAYLLSLIAHSRRHVTLICGRRGSDGEPLLPSRLLFATDSDSVVRRVRRFADERANSPRVVVPRPRVVPGSANLFPTLPAGRKPLIDSMRVTSFRTFLASPYQFYLEQVLKLEERVEQPPEIDPMDFGTLIHCVLEAFGTSDASGSTNEETIRDCLRDHLNAIALDRYGPHPPVAVAIQLEVAALRLDEFGRFQKGHRERGWHIDAIEWKPQDGRAKLAGLPFDFFIRGKIDRIDRHDDGRVAILDYKTSEQATTPRQTHGCSQAWKDLQLPLYRHLARERGLPENEEAITLAYVTLPSRPGGIRLCAGDWTPDDLADADNTARDVATRVHNGDWLELGDEPPEDGTFGALCGTAFLSADASAGTEGGEE